MKTKNKQTEKKNKTKIEYKIMNMSHASPMDERQESQKNIA